MGLGLSDGLGVGVDGGEGPGLGEDIEGVWVLAPRSFPFLLKRLNPTKGTTIKRVSASTNLGFLKGDRRNTYQY